MSSTEKFMINRESFCAEVLAYKGQEIPDALDWLSWQDGPTIRWDENQIPISSPILRGWVLMASARGNPEPDDEQRAQAALLGRGDAEIFGRWLLGRWIEYDVRAPELSPAREASLRALAEHAAALATRFGRPGTDPDQRFHQLLAQEENRPPPSALPYQGLLAIVAVCGGDEVVRDVDRFLARWHATRVASCGALLRMLSWVRSSTTNEALENASRLPQLRDQAKASLSARHRRALVS